MRMPLAGLRVLDLGQLVAGSFCTQILADFGAEVIKIEQPKTGDPLRQWRILHQGTSLWWYVVGRNKKSVALDLRHPRGQEIARQLAARVDLVVENFRPGTLERWGLGYEELAAVNPRLILVRISGFGQDGPYREKAGFASVAEAMGGLRYLTGWPDRPPTRVGLSLGDSIAAMWAVIGAMHAIYYRDAAGGGRGQVVDVSLCEAVFALLESTLVEYEYAGVVRERSGNALPGIAPSNTYPTADNQFVVIAANSDALFQRLMQTIGREDLARDLRFETNPGRAAHMAELDEAIAAWVSARDLSTVLAAMDAAGVPAGPIYSIADIVRDPQFQARGMIEEVPVAGLGRLRMQAVIPKLSYTPGVILWAGPALGAHTHEVLQGELGISDSEMAALREAGVV